MRSAIGPYQLLEPLGEGGMGVVYEGRDPRLNRTVAIKMIRPVAVSDPIARERFWREARAVAGMNHPGICQVYEVGEDEGELFLAMELLRGETLERRLKRGALTLDEALPLALGMLGPLSAIHQRGL